MTDRQLAIHLGRAILATLSLALLLVSGITYAESTYQPPVVEIGQPQ